MFEVLNANGSLPASRLYLYDKANGLVLIGKGRPSGIVPLGNRLGVTTVFLTDSVGNVLSESSLTSKYRMTELPSLPDTIAADSIGAWLERIGSSDGKSVFARFATKNECWNQFAESELQYKSDYASPLPFPDNFFKENAKNRSVDLQMSADEIETVELLRPWQALAYTWGAVDGAIKVTTRGADKSKVRSKGIFYTPFGLSVVKGNPKTTVTPGKYRLLMDVVSPTDITSFERDIVVGE